MLSGETISQRRRTTARSDHILINDQVSIHEQLNLVSQNTSPTYTPPTSASASADVTHHARDWINTNQGSGYKSLQENTHFDTVEHELNGRENGCKTVSGQYEVFALQPRPVISFSTRDPTHPRRRSIKTISHQLSTGETFPVRLRPIFDSTNINEAIYSSTSIERRLREANYNAFPRPREADARSASGPSIFTAKLDYIIWPTKVVTRDENDGEVVLIGHADAATTIVALRAMDQEKIFLVAYNMAAAVKDVAAMSTYHKMHFNSLLGIEADIQNNEINLRALRRWEDRTAKTTIACASAFNKGHIAKEELKRWIRRKREAAAFSKNKQRCERTWDKRLEKRALFSLLEKWDHSWVTMGGQPSNMIRRLKRDLKTRPPRWVDKQRGWLGLVADDVTEESFGFVKIDRTLRTTRGPQHDRGTCERCMTLRSG